MTPLLVACEQCQTESVAEIKMTFTHRIELRPPMQWAAHYAANVNLDQSISMRVTFTCRNCACLKNK